MTKLPAAWLPSCTMRRIIVHWSEGWRVSNDTDRAHYHLLIEQTPEGVVRVIRGDHSIADNSNTSDGDYAAHTRGCNTGSIGVALCGMVGCQQNPFKPGAAPITEAQWNLMLDVVAELCMAYGIVPTPETVLCHGEVQRNLGIVQRGKWDPMRWPWDLSVRSEEIGARLRSAVVARLASGKVTTTPVQAPPVRRVVTLPSSKALAHPNVSVDDGDTLVALRPLCEAMGYEITRADGKSATIKVNGAEHTLEIELVGGMGFVVVRELAEALGWSVRWEKATNRVVLAAKTEGTEL